MAILPLPLIQEEHLSVNGERIGARYSKLICVFFGIWKNVGFLTTQLINRVTCSSVLQIGMEYSAPMNEYDT